MRYISSSLFFTRWNFHLATHSKYKITANVKKINDNNNFADVNLQKVACLLEFYMYIEQQQQNKIK